ncbi:arginine--tRNA ligase [Candidatus Woesearchaeota archaeon]|nr:arginine--tRNA ligase [Candidatus Woesearchaeota archaeon]
MFQEEIINIINQEIKKQIKLEIPPKKEMGDFAFPCFGLSKEKKKSPVEIAKELASKLKPTELVEKIVPTGAYVNFFLDKSKVAEIVLTQIYEQKDEYGGSKLGEQKVVCIDYSHPNIAKPFGIGHLRSTMIGRAICNMLKFHSYKPLGLNHLGDWGTQFGALIYAHLTWGDRERLKTDPIRYLLDIYVKFNKEKEKTPELQDEAKRWFKKLEQGDTEAMKLWAKFRDLSLEEFQRVYKLLGVDFESYDGEAFFKDKFSDSIELVKTKVKTELSEGALIVPLEDFEIPAIIIKSDGTSTYLTRDIAAALYRLKTYRPHQILYVVGSEQKLHFKMLFKIMGLLGKDKKKFKHVNFGFYLSPEGGKMATRKGKIVFMEDVLNESIELAKKTIEEKNPELKNKDEVAKQVGVGAVIFYDLVNDRIRDVVFDWKRILDFEGDTGPYLMYTFARASSIVRKLKEKKNLEPDLSIDFSKLSNKTEQLLAVLLSKFQDKISESLEQYKPHILAQYLIELGRAFNEFYHSCPCLKEEDSEIQKARLLLIDCTRQIIKTGLRLLSVNAPEEM